jgi:hypothetical protein
MAVRPESVMPSQSGRRSHDIVADCAVIVTLTGPLVARGPRALLATPLAGFFMAIVPAIYGLGPAE